ncbi:hypothetical protein OHA21_05245 [Actinoplanes sp. NBC_00393]|uniref:hypothetical protein n=1 Tax=Actinoplanes sp. NBC_00393 TaxID=2975953 RepID=UPI002E1D2AF1
MSYVLITVNLLLNILIAVIVNSMEEARRLEMTERLATDEDHDGIPDEIDRIMISQRLDDLRALIAELEQDLRLDRDDGARLISPRSGPASGVAGSPPR